MMDFITAKLCAVPELTKLKRVLFIQPHPDDNEIGAGGTIAYLRSRGAEVWGLTVMDDHLVCPPEQIVDGHTLRQREALAAQNVLGVKHAGFLGFADKTDAPAEEIAAAIIPVIRRIQPDAVFSVDPRLENECHRDHIKTGWAVRYAVMDAAWEHCQPESAPWETPVLGQYFTDHPNKIVDISGVWEQKREAVRQHRSQVSEPLMLAIRKQAEYFGKQESVKLGEAVRLLSFLQLHCFNLPVGSFDRESERSRS